MEDPRIKYRGTQHSIVECAKATRNYRNEFLIWELDKQDTRYRGTVAAEMGLANEVGGEGQSISFVFNVINAMWANVRGRRRGVFLLYCCCMGARGEFVIVWCGRVRAAGSKENRRLGMAAVPIKGRASPPSSLFFPFLSFLAKLDAFSLHSCSFSNN